MCVYSPGFLYSTGEKIPKYSDLHFQRCVGYTACKNILERDKMCHLRMSVD